MDVRSRGDKINHQLANKIIAKIWPTLRQQPSWPSCDHHMIIKWTTCPYPCHLWPTGDQHYSWIACQLEVGTPIITFAVDVKFQTQTSFGFLSQLKLPRLMYLNFFVKPKNGLVWPVWVFRLKKVLSRSFFVRASIIKFNNWVELSEYRVERALRA